MIGLFVLFGFFSFAYFVANSLSFQQADPVLADVQASAVQAAANFTASTLIGSGDATYDGQDIICDGTAGGSINFQSTGLISGSGSLSANGTQGATGGGRFFIHKHNQAQSGMNMV